MPSLIGSSYATFVLNLSLALDEPVSVSPTPGAILESPITEATIYVRDPLIHGSVVSLEALLVDLWHQLTQVVLKKRGLV